MSTAPSTDTLGQLSQAEDAPGRAEISWRVIGIASSTIAAGLTGALIVVVAVDDPTLFSQRPRSPWQSCHSGHSSWPSELARLRAASDGAGHDHLRPNAVAPLVN